MLKIQASRSKPNFFAFLNGLGFEGTSFTCSASSFALFKNNFIAHIHSKSSPKDGHRTKINNTHFENFNVEAALDSFPKMLRTRSIVAFTQLLGKLVRTKHYSLVISEILLFPSQEKLEN
ncbi:hypothetical protein L484_012767 [Morus notabilis]|uniref:Uncharacterized protein n=1 Tax=Morus notabilis TaxID=981085 RepID=W9SK67_9ROSA|nr:hypothetical protein L484_012767 [Morus notabilis]